GREARVDAAQKEAARLAEAMDEIAERLLGLEAEREAAALRKREAEELRRQTELDLTDQWERRRVEGLAATARQQDLDGRRSALQEKESRIAGERSALDQARERAREGEIARTRAQSDRRFLDELCAQELGITAEQAAAAAGEEALATADDQALEAEV